MITIVTPSNEHDFSLGMNLLEILRKQDHNVNQFIAHDPREMPAERQHQFYFGLFSNAETRIAVGHEFAETLGDFVVAVGYLEARLPGFNLSEKVDQWYKFIECLKRQKKSRQVVSVTPHIPYIRAHSIDKLEKEGVTEADGLARFVLNMHFSGVDAVVTIDPHSDKIRDLFEKVKIPFYGIDPFNLADSPFLDWVHSDLADFESIAVVTPDVGGLLKGKDFALYLHAEHVPFEKDRPDAGTVDRFEVMPKYEAKVKALSGANVLIVDDMICGGGTADDLAKDLRSKYGSSKVYLLCTHPICPDADKIEELQNLNGIVTLRTIPCKRKPNNLVCLEGMEQMLADKIHELYIQ